MAKITKIVSMGALAAGAWILNWVFVSEIIYQNQPLTFIGWPSLTTILGIIFLSFFFLINKNWIASIIFDVIIVGGYIIVMPKEFYVILGGAAFLVFLVLFERRLLSDHKSNSDFSFRRVTSWSISFIIYALLLLIGLNIYYNTQVQFKANSDAYYDRLAEVATKTVSRVVDPSFRPMADIIALSSVDRVREANSGNEKYFPILFSLIVVAVLGTFAFVLRWATIFTGWLMFKVLLMAGFFKLEKEMAEVEKLDI